MWKNISKFLFAIFIIGLIIYVVYTTNNQNNISNQLLVDETTHHEEIKTDIRLAVTNYDTINPLITNNKEVINIGKLIFEPLVTINEDYKAELCLAKECTQVDETTYLIKIDNSVRWHDGSAFVAKDVQFTIDRIKEGNSIYATSLQDVTSIEVIDASTLKIYLSRDIPFFEYNLTFPILPSDYYLGEDFYTSEKIPLGTGMYKISKIEGSNIELVKNKDWRKIDEIDSKIETVNVRLYSSMGEAYKILKLGNIEVLNTSNLNYQDYTGTIGFNVTEFKGREYDFLALNCQSEILSNKEVRKALSYAIDKTAIVNNVLNGTYYTSDYPLDYGSFLYQNVAGSSGYNPEQVNTSLTENGWSIRNGIWQKNVDGRYIRIQLNLVVNSDNSTRLQVANNIKEQLAQVGIEINIQEVSADTYNEKLQNRDYDIILTGVYNSLSPDLTSFFGENNYSNYINDDVINMLQRASTIADENELKSMYQSIYDRVQDDMPIISLYRNKNITLTNQSLSGEIKPNNYFTYYNIENWSRK